MSLTSRPKNRDTDCPAYAEKSVLSEAIIEERWKCEDDEELPPSRVSFHKTFSLLINMGNIEKGCKRAVSTIFKFKAVLWAFVQRWTAFVRSCCGRLLRIRSTLHLDFMDHIKVVPCGVWAHNYSAVCAVNYWIYYVQPWVDKLYII